MNIEIWIREIIDGWNYHIRKFRHRAVAKTAESVLKNLDLVNAVEGAKTSAAFEKEYLLTVATFKRRKTLFEQALALAPNAGLFLEFGTYKGDSINQLAKLRPGLRFVGFDSFVGLPEGWTAGTRKGGLSAKGRLPQVRENVELVTGFFEDSLPGFLAAQGNETVAFLHIDCDLYSSTIFVLNAIRDRLVKGSVIVFDEFYNYAEWQDGEYKAWMEFCEKENLSFRYIGYIRMGGQVAVQIE